MKLIAIEENIIQYRKVTRNISLDILDLDYFLHYIYYIIYKGKKDSL